MKRIPYILIPGCFFILLYLAFRLYLDSTHAFPDLPVGAYSGKMSFSREKRTYPLYIDRPGKNPTIIISIGAEFFSAQVVTLASKPGIAENVFIPLTLVSEQRRLRFEGKLRNPGEYEGSIQDLESGDTGTWQVKTHSDTMDDTNLLNWSEHFITLRRIYSEVDAATIRLKQQESRLSELKHIIGSDSALLAEAGVKQKAKESELLRLKTALDVSKTQLHDLEVTLSTGRKTTPYGKLVELSRDTLARDYSWINAELQLVKAELSPDFEAQLTRAEKIKALKLQIEQEKARIEEIQNDPVSEEEYLEVPDREEEKPEEIEPEEEEEQRSGE